MLSFLSHVVFPWILCALNCLLVLMSCSDENIEQFAHDARFKIAKFTVTR